MRFTIKNQTQHSTAVTKTTRTPSQKTTAPQSQNAMGAMFQNMIEGKYRSNGCSSCSGTR